MKLLKPQPNLTEQVYQALMDEICEGRLLPGTQLVQEQLAEKLGVSRQPIQQSLAMLKNDGLLQELGKRGLYVAPVDIASMHNHYEIRAALDGLAARRAAERAKASTTCGAAFQREGSAKLAAGHAASAKGSITALVQSDIAFHDFVYASSGNPLLKSTAAPHWRQMRRAMGEVLRHAEPPQAIWVQHEEILDAIVRGEPARAQARAIAHVRSAAERLERSLAATPPAAPARRSARSTAETGK